MSPRSSEPAARPGPVRVHGHNGARSGALELTYRGLEDGVHRWKAACPAQWWTALVTHQASLRVDVLPPHTSVELVCEPAEPNG